MLFRHGLYAKKYFIHNFIISRWGILAVMGRGFKPVLWLVFSLEVSFLACISTCATLECINDCKWLCLQDTDPDEC